MTPQFEELDFQQTPLGEISLRRRAEARLDGQILYEVKLGDEFLMTSLFTEAEVELARLCLAAIEAERLDVVVGGLGLGYTAVAALQSPKVSSLTVIDVLEPVIEWHRKGLVPLGGSLTSDRRCTLKLGDFFKMATMPGCGFYADQPGRLVHAVLLDIDHSPRHWLNQQNSSFYSQDALQIMIRKIHPGGVFGLWSNDPPDVEFTALLDSVFQCCQTHIVTFANPYTGCKSSNTVYIARNN